MPSHNFFEILIICIGNVFKIQYFIIVIKKERMVIFQTLDSFLKLSKSETKFPQKLLNQLTDETLFKEITPDHHDFLKLKGRDFHVFADALDGLVDSVQVLQTISFSKWTDNFIRVCHHISTGGPASYGQVVG